MSRVHEPRRFKSPAEKPLPYITASSVQPPAAAARAIKREETNQRNSIALHPVTFFSFSSPPSTFPPFIRSRYMFSDCATQLRLLVA